MGIIKVFQFILFLLIQIIFIPLMVIGLFMGIYKEFARGRKLGVSYSAGQALQYRWYMHYFDTRPDRQTIEFTKRFPCESHFGLWTTMGALILAQRLFGFKTKVSRLPEAGKETLDNTAAVRVLAFDKIMEKYIDEVDQIVLPGVGFDLIALRYAKGKNIRVFELDQISTLNVKMDTLSKAGIDSNWITYVPVNYETESWATKLLYAGFDRTKKTLFVWQSVSLFLDARSVEQTLREMTDLSSKESIISMDFYSENFIFNDNSLAVKSQRNLMRKMGEPWVFGLDMSKNPEATVKSFLNDVGLVMIEYKQFGEKLNIEPFYCIVEAVKK